VTASLRAAGLDQMALSLDGWDEPSHDGFRRVDGSFARTMAAAAWARELGLPLQIDTVFGAWNAGRFPELAALVESLGVVFWEVFFLVPTGRGAELDGCTAEQCERLFADLYEMSRRAPFIIKITEAPHYRRFVQQQAGHSGARPPAMRDVHRHAAATTDAGLRVTRQGVNSGKGFCFVDHVGDIYPSGFLPMLAGNVRRDAIADTYRTAPIFVALRDPDRLKGRCGACEYREICGGSRSRAFALTGDPFAEDGSCGYVPDTDVTASTVSH
jgi:radical SAM protein with 4Fe4S-binding SPASM domain